MFIRHSELSFHKKSKLEDGIKGGAECFMTCRQARSSAVERKCVKSEKTHIEKKSKGEKIIILISFQLFAAIEWDFSLWLNWTFNWLPLPFLASLKLWIVLIQQPTTVSVERNSSLLFICLIIISLFRFDKFFRQLECYKFENSDKSGKGFERSVERIRLLQSWFVSLLPTANRCFVLFTPSASTRKLLIAMMMHLWDWKIARFFILCFDFSLKWLSSFLFLSQ